MKSLFKHIAPLRPILSVVLVGTVLALAWFATRHLVNEISYDDMIKALAATPSWAIVIALLCTAASFGTLMVYDVSALTYCGRSLPMPLVALASFCSYAVGNTAGFGPLTAGAIRYRFYTPHGFAPEDIARIVGFVTAAFGLGLAGVLGISFLAATLAVPSGMLETPFAVPPALLQSGGLAVVLALVGLGWWAGHGRTITVFGLTMRLPSRSVMTWQFLATVADMVLSAVVLWVLLPWGKVDLVSFMAIYSVAIGLGILSHVPAGLGVFETVIVAALSHQVDVDQILGALVLYRICYHLVPLAVAALLITILEARRAAGLPLVGALFRVSSRLAPPVLGAVAVVVGGMIIVSAATPHGLGGAPTLMPLPLPVMEVTHFLGGLLGVILVMVARGLVYRLHSAWSVAIVSTPVSLVIALAHGALVTAALLAVLSAGLWLTRSGFSRPASLFQQAITRGWAIALSTALVTAVTLLFFAYKDIDYANHLWVEFAFEGAAPRSLRTLLGMGIVALFGTAWALQRPAMPPLQAPSPQDLAQAQAIAALQERTEAVLVSMGDKHLLFSEDRQAFLMYGRQGRSWIALFDPVGPRCHWPELIWRFVEMARRCGGRPAFYQVAPESLAYYADAGLRAFKLGEEARVDLRTYDLKGAKHTRLRHRLNRAEKDGLELEIIPREAVAAYIPTLQAVSDVWMRTHNVREKRFSLGNFDPAYLCTQPVAVVRQDGQIVAFTTLMLTEQTAEARIDLIRYLPEAPKGVMDILLARLMFLYKDAGYDWFILGMAPLSGLSDSEAAPMWHHVGREVFEHGEWFYNFSGLRTFKDKFQPQWQARYLAVPGGVNPMMALADITVLISGGLKGVIGK